MRVNKITSLFLKLPRLEFGQVRVLKQQGRSSLCMPPVVVQGCKLATFKAAESLFTLEAARGYVTKQAEH